MACDTVTHIATASRPQECESGFGFEQVRAWLTHSCSTRSPALARGLYGQWSWMEWRVSTRWSRENTSMDVGRRTVRHAVLYVLGYCSAWRSFWVNPWHSCSLNDFWRYIRKCVRERKLLVPFILRWRMLCITRRLNICTKNACYTSILPSCLLKLTIKLHNTEILLASYGCEIASILHKEEGAEENIRS